MGVSNEAKSVIHLKFLRKIKNKKKCSSCELSPGTYGILKVNVKESIVNSPRITDHGSAV
jgi:hypothetical protein